MSTQSFTIDTQSRIDGWRLAAIAMLAVRFVQGWIFWGGGSRRFIYAPSKLDPSSHTWLANKFQSAMPGALLGMDKVVDYMLHHFTLMYTGAVLFSAAELVFGLFLLFGFMTRLSALVSIGFSVVLMLLFGWQGATCIDEWTMAASNFGMGVTLFVAGSAAYSVDSWMMRRNPALAQRGWFQWFGSGAWSAPRVNRVGLIGVVLTILFVVLTYNHYRGSVFTPFHSGPVSPSKHHVSLSDGKLDSNGAVSFTAYLDAGTPEAPSNIVRAELIDPQGKLVEAWDSAALAALPKTAFVNDFNYNKFAAGYAGITAEMGARAIISLPPAQATVSVPSGTYKLVLRSVNGHSYATTLQRP